MQMYFHIKSVKLFQTNKHHLRLFNQDYQYWRLQISQQQVLSPSVGELSRMHQTVFPI